MTDNDLRERLVRLETELEHVTAKLDSVAIKVSELLDILNAARGARYLLIAAAGVAGFLSGKIGALIPTILPPLK